MASYQALTSLQIKKAVESVKKNKPAYGEILDFYGQVFDAQEDSKDRIQLKPVPISKELLTARAKQKLPLIDVGCFVYDKTESVNLFMTICNLATATNPKLAAAAKAILNAAQNGLKPEALFQAFLGGNEDLFETVAGELDIEKQIIGFVAANSLNPSLCLCADQLSQHLDHTDPWLAGCCPVCGSEPILSILEQKGRRKLVCSFCWQVWSAGRGSCPYCGSGQNEDLSYFYSEEERGARVDLCGHCHKYIKTIDTRKLDRRVYPPLELISSLHLDIKAQEIGFAPGIRLFVQM